MQSFAVQVSNSQRKLSAVLKLQSLGPTKNATFFAVFYACLHKIVSILDYLPLFYHGYFPAYLVERSVSIHVNQVNQFSQSNVL